MIERGNIRHPVDTARGYVAAVKEAVVGVYDEKIRPYMPNTKRALTAVGIALTVTFSIDDMRSSNFSEVQIDPVDPQCPQLSFLPIVANDSSDPVPDAAMPFSDSAPAETSAETVFPNVRDMSVGEMHTVASLTGTVPVRGSTLVRMHDTTAYDPYSPDPSGLAYISETHEVVVVDAEVDEPNHNGTTNVWVLDADTGAVKYTGSTVDFSREPTDVAVSGGTWFFTDDDKKKVFVVDTADGIFGNGNDEVASFRVDDFIQDPEGAAIIDGKLLVTDGVGQQIVFFDPGANGIIDGPCRPGDDVISSVSTVPFQQLDPEDVEAVFDPAGSGTFTMTIASRGNHDFLSRVWVDPDTGRATFVDIVDISNLAQRNPAGVAVVPGADGDPPRTFIAFRGTDNGSDPDENDGKIGEITVNE